MGRVHGIGGGNDSPSADDVIRARFRELIEGGVLPRGAPKRVVASRSDGRGRCTACGRDFVRGDVQYEITTLKAIVVAFHRRCFDLWPEVEEGQMS